MVLKDHNYSHFIGGLAFLLMGIAITVLFMSENILVPIFGAIFAIIGGWLFISTKIVNIALDKSTNKGTISLWSILKKEHKEIALSDVRELKLQKVLETSRSSKGGRKTYYQFSLVFVLKTSEELPFEFGKVSASILDVLKSPDEGKIKEATQVAEFLGVPLTRTGTSTVSEVTSAIKEGIAKGIGGIKKS